jgi:hypothetical protein
MARSSTTYCRQNIRSAVTKRPSSWLSGTRQPSGFGYADDILSIARRGQTVSEDTTAFGYKYVRDGVIESPNGRMIGMRTIWMSDEPDGPPRLATAYPA